MMAGLAGFSDWLSTMISAVMMTGDGDDDDDGDVDVCDDDDGGDDDGVGDPFLSAYDGRFGDASSILTNFSSSNVAVSI